MLVTVFPVIELPLSRQMLKPLASHSPHQLALHLQQRLGDLSTAQISRKRERFASLAASLDAMSPLKVLGRGYAVARGENGEILRSAGDVELGDHIQVKLGRGILGCTVDERTEE